MSCLTCDWNNWRMLSRAAAKAASARFRSLGALTTAPNWAARATVCESCPIRVSVRGVSHCGKPFLDQVRRDPTIDGCGCPTHDKAKSPEEHCPINERYQAARTVAGRCNCKWCVKASPRVGRTAARV